MKIWEINEDVNDYLAIILKKEESIRKFSKIFEEQRSLMNNWVQKEVSFFDDKGGKKKGDFFYMTYGIHVVNDKASSVFREFIRNENAELLPIVVDDERLYILNTLRFIDCIDLDKSLVGYYRDSNRILSIDKYCFKPEMVINEDIFKSTLQPFGRIFISDRLKLKLEQSGIQGVKFDEIWDSEG